MKILLVIDHLGLGGAQRQLVTLAKGLSLKGHSIGIFVYYPEYTHFESELCNLNIKIHKFHKKSKFSLSVMMNLVRTLRDNQYQIALSFLNTPNFYLEVASLFLKDIPIVVSERSTFLPGRVSTKMRLQKQFHRLADHVTVNSYYQQTRMLEEFPWVKSKLSTIYNGLDLGHFRPFSRAENTHDAHDANPFEFLVLSNAAPLKNALGLARSLAVYRERFGKLPVIRWAGRFTNAVGDKAYLDEVNDFIERNGLKGHWSWLGVRSDVVELLNSHHALIHPSFYEGLPNAVCEALACGRPVIVSSVCEHPRLVQNTETGFLFKPDDSGDIALKMHDFCLLTERERSLMGEKARDFAEKNLSIERYISDYEKLFESLGSRRRLQAGA